MTRTLTYDIFKGYVDELYDYDDIYALGEHERIKDALDFFSTLFPNDVPYIRHLAAQALNAYRNEHNEYRKRGRERREAGLSLDYGRLTEITRKHMQDGIEQAFFSGNRRMDVRP